MKITDYAHYSVLLHYYQNEISDYAHYSVFTFIAIKMDSLTTLTTPKTISLTTLTTLFTFTTIKIKSLTTLSTLFYFTTSNPRDRTTLTTLLLSLTHLFFSQEFQCFHIICMCDSNFTVRKFSGVLHALLPKNQSK